MRGPALYGFRGVVSHSAFYRIVIVFRGNSVRTEKHVRHDGRPDFYSGYVWGRYSFHREDLVSEVWSDTLLTAQKLCALQDSKTVGSGRFTAGPAGGGQAWEIGLQPDLGASHEPRCGAGLEAHWSRRQSLSVRRQR